MKAFFLGTLTAIGLALGVGSANAQGIVVGGVYGQQSFYRGYYAPIYQPVPVYRPYGYYPPAVYAAPRPYYHGYGPRYYGGFNNAYYGPGFGVSVYGSRGGFSYYGR